MTKTRTRKSSTRTNTGTRTRTKPEPEAVPVAEPGAAPAAEPEVKFGVDLSRGFTEWLATKRVSLAITTYQVGKLILFGLDEEGKLWSYNRNIGRCLGMCVDGDGFWVTSEAQLIRFGNLLPPGQTGQDGTDVLYGPRFSYFTGDLDIHDVVQSPEGLPLFANTLFNCVARPSPSHSFELVWKPDFISRFVAEDQCHLNGIAMRDGRLKYVTAVSRSAVFDGWRDQRTDGGLVIDVDTNDILCTGLSMPHSPRWHGGRLWLHNSGTGEFGHVDLETGRFVPVVFCPGYLRGLDFFDETIAVVGLSLSRDNKTFSDLPISEKMEAAGVAARRGLYFIDLQSGTIIHSMVFEGVVTELYDVAVLPGVRKPGLIGPSSPELKRTLSVPQMGDG